ncbi:pseudaminic acid synthase [Brevundimonas intermedia]|uniref:Pseudaminic acid synthase n=1 Tax=Brevundimonas intermedia TaxID=74315 RepID=A0A4Y9S0T5_9CAUL|nr:pseudaminic acid synthase [Brevundimonas intermedia]TFW13549.1 pseudaminic acid synthase [Brevundimonas intermedia]
MSRLKQILTAYTDDGDMSPFIIAEMSGNHNGSLEQALKIVDAAADAGADAIKLQTYTADTMTLNIAQGEFVINDPKSLWKGRALYDLYAEAHTPWEWHAPIMQRARERSIFCFSSPFDSTAVDLLESLDVPCYKIASFECIDLSLIKRVAATGKPMIISTGMATIQEIAEAVDTARTGGCPHVVVLKCTSNYPAPPEHSNLLTIPHMAQLLGCEVGLSDHTMGIGVPVAACALGATVIEKHFVLNRADGGVDAAFSAEPDELASLVQEAHRARQALGQVKYGPTDVEVNARNRRRSLYIAQDMQAGDVLTKDNLRSIRPGLGLPPKYLEVLIGRRISKSAKRGDRMSWDLIG